MLKRAFHIFEMFRPAGNGSNCYGVMQIVAGAGQGYYGQTELLRPLTQMC